MDFFLGGRSRKTAVDLVVGKGQEKQRKLSVLSDDGVLNCDVDKGRRGSVRDDPAPVVVPVAQAALARKAAKEADRVDFVKYFGAQLKPEPKKKSKVLKVASDESIGIDDATKAEGDPERLESAESDVPEGVLVLDCPDHSCSVYGRDIDIYLRRRERLYNAALAGGLPAFCKSRNLVARSKLVNWLILVVHYFKFSQQTFYLAISIFDKVVITSSCAYELQQLLGVACVLIASKMEEYFPASFEKLLAVTQSSYTESELCSMERAIYRQVKFEVICEEPVTFMDRFIAAAEKSEDTIFREICFFMMDTIVTDLFYWSNLTSHKSAAAVYAALLVETADDPVHLPHVWTKSLEYYTGFQEDKLFEISLAMLEKAERIVKETPSEAAKALKKHFLDGVASKFMSGSRHEALLTLPVMEQNYVTVALSFLRRKCEADAA